MSKTREGILIMPNKKIVIDSESATKCVTTAPVAVADLACLRCGYTWEPRAYRLRDHLPRACPQCKSRAWQSAKVIAKEPSSV